jgi:hypothetical protein
MMSAYCGALGPFVAIGKDTVISNYSLSRPQSLAIGHNGVGG